MKKSFLYVLVFLMTGLMLSSVLTPIHAQEKKKPNNSASSEEDSNIDMKVYQPAGIIVDSALIKAGDSLQLLWGVLGPPDKLNALRGKDNVEQDYVKIQYHSYGLSFDLSNKANSVQGILIYQNESLVSLSNIPFKIGQKLADVQKSWGNPETTTDKLLAYWRRGVYFGIGENDSIRYIFITKVGVFDEEKE